MTQRQQNWNGMNWIRQEKRLAIYLRDGLSCVYCGKGPEEVTLSLDHLKPDANGGTNHESNLVTCCETCNKSRGTRPWMKFARITAEYAGCNAEEVIKHIKRCISRKLDTKEAKELIKAQGSCFKVIKNRQQHKLI